MKFAALLALFLAVGCGPSQARHTLSGTLTLPWGQCITESAGSGTLTGTGGYSDIAVGTSVVVKDQSGTVLATGHLSFKSGNGCHWNLKVTDIPDASFYQVEVSHRGAITYSRADLDKANWEINLSLG